MIEIESYMKMSTVTYVHLDIGQEPLLLIWINYNPSKDKQF